LNKQVEPVLQVRLSGADEMRFMGLLVLVYVVTVAIVVLLAGKNLGRKVPAPTQAELESVAAPA
jgi:hypothetical protein